MRSLRSGLALSDSDDEGGGAGAGGGRAAGSAARSTAAGVSSLEQLKDAAKRRKTDALFAEMNTAAPQPKPAASAAAQVAVPAKGTKLRCMLRAQVRAGHEMGSATAGELKVGETVEILETKVLQPAGTVRCRFARGWVSMRTGAGKTILQKIAAPASMFPTATRPAGTGAALGMAERIKAGVGVGGAAKPAAAAAEGAAGASGPAGAAPVRKNKMNDILAGLKKGQISTTAKSRGQWQDYKKQEGIDEELQAKAKNGSATTHSQSHNGLLDGFPSLSSLICCVFVARYLEKQEFLERVDWREHENELENKKDVGWKGLN